MSTTAAEFYTETTGALEAAWVAAPGIVGVAEVPLLFEDVPYMGQALTWVPKSYFGRYSMRPAIERQASLRDGFVKRYESSGIIFVQVFAPKSDVQGRTLGAAMAEMAKLVYRGAVLPGCPIFSNVRVNRLDPEVNFYRWNVVAEYEYDEIG